jgi:hypothetical protein
MTFPLPPRLGIRSSLQVFERFACLLRRYGQCRFDRFDPHLRTRIFIQAQQRRPLIAATRFQLFPNSFQLAIELITFAWFLWSSACSCSRAWLRNRSTRLSTRSDLRFGLFKVHVFKICVLYGGI